MLEQIGIAFGIGLGVLFVWQTFVYPSAVVFHAGVVSPP